MHANVDQQSPASLMSSASDCKEGSLHFNGSCYAEFTRGPPCPGDQWLVQQSTATGNESGTAGKSGECRKWPCAQPGHYLWTIPLRARISNSSAPSRECAGRDYPCGDHEVGFVYEEEGTAECDCRSGTVYWKRLDFCRPLFSHGPCRHRLVLVYDPASRRVSCQRNPCRREHLVMWTDGICYDIGDDIINPCQRSEVLAVNRTSLEVACTPAQEYYRPKPKLILESSPRDCQTRGTPEIAQSRRCSNVATALNHLAGGTWMHRVVLILPIVLGIASELRSQRQALYSLV